MTVPISNITASWTSSSNTYTGIGMNVTSTAYNSESKLINLKRDGNSKFSVDAGGNTIISGNTVISGNIIVYGTSNLQSNVNINDSLTVKNLIKANVLTSNTSNITTANITFANVTYADVSSLNVKTLNVSSVSVGGSSVPVSAGGTGVSSINAYAVMCGGTTTTNPTQSLSSVGTAGQVLKSAGVGLLPLWQNSMTYLGAATPVVGTNTVTLSGLTLTPYKMLFFDVDNVSFNGSYFLKLQNIRVSEASGGGGIFMNGIIALFLDSGNVIGIVGTAAVTGYVGVTYCNQTNTSITFTTSAGTFDAGAIKVYGI